MFFDAAPWESAAFTNLFSKNHFFVSPGKRMRYISHSTYHWVLPWHIAKTPRIGLQRLPLFFFFNLLLLLFFFFGVLESFVFFYIFDYVILGSYDNGPKTIHTENLYPSVTSIEKLRSIWCQMRSQVYLISERGQKILYWKLGQSCCFIFFFYFYFYSIFFIAIQWILPTTGVVHTSIIPQYFFIIVFGVFRCFWHIWWRHQ